MIIFASDAAFLSANDVFSLIVAFKAKQHYHVKIAACKYYLM